MIMQSKSTHTRKENVKEKIEEKNGEEKKEGERNKQRKREWNNYNCCILLEK